VVVAAGAVVVTAGAVDVELSGASVVGAVDGPVDDAAVATEGVLRPLDPESEHPSISTPKELQASSAGAVRAQHRAGGRCLIANLLGRNVAIDGAQSLAHASHADGAPRAVTAPGTAAGVR
jgi:hypothetical protein